VTRAETALTQMLIAGESEADAAVMGSQKPARASGVLWHSV
jgi:hypothetical protein